MRDYYYILGIESNASDTEIKQAYRKLSHKFHPDKNDGDSFFEKRFKEILEAYETLSDKNKRIIYDSTFSRYKTHNRSRSKDQVVGEIISFEVNKKIVSTGDEVTFFWATKNVANVQLSCFDGILPVSGKKSVKISKSNSKTIEISLKAFDPLGRVLVEKLTLSYNPNLPNEEKTKSISSNKEKPPLSSRSKGFLWVLSSIIMITFILIISNQWTKSPEQKAAEEIAATMVSLPGGKFTMGCTSEQGSDCYNSENPAHLVTLSGYKINKYEVTQSQWEVIFGNNPSRFKHCNRCPVESVSWNDVQEFIQKLNKISGLKYRLPTEAEWEYAARGGQSYKYSGSNKIGSVAWYEKNDGSSKTHPVGQKYPNGYGLYDMSGNVWEWCSDGYRDYNTESQSNPRGSLSSSLYVNRGGSWLSKEQLCRVSVRAYTPPMIRYDFIGFRLAR